VVQSGCKCFALEVTAKGLDGCVEIASLKESPQ
jgi:hypothetical protein